MSQSASFFLLPATRFDDLFAIATPRVVRTEVRRLLVFKRVSEKVVDDFLPFVREVGRRAERCDFPGDFFMYLDFALGVHGVTLFQLARSDLSEALSAKRVHPQVGPSRLPSWIKGPLRDRIPVFDRATATEALDRLDAAGLSESDLRRVAVENFAAHEHEAAVSTLQGVLELTKRWLASVREGELGLLTIS